MKKESFKELSYLAGFHLKKPDYNFKAKTGELFNVISDITEREFEVLDIGDDLILLKNKDLKHFEIRFDSRKLIYEDEVETFNNFQSKALLILEGWQKLNPAAKILRLGGTMRRILLSEERPKGTYSSVLFENYIQNLSIGGKNKQISLHLNYDYTRKGNDYNVNIYLDEILEKEYLHQCRLDINQIDSDGSKRINLERVKNIFNFSDKYYREEFINDLNIK